MKYVIIGGVATGASAAARLRQLDEHAEIVLLERGASISYANCGLPYHVGGVIKDRARLSVMPPAKFAAWFNVGVRTNCEATTIDREKKEVVCADETGTSRLRYDKLLIATGSMPVGDAYTDTTHPHVAHLWTLADMDRVMGKLSSVAGRRALPGRVIVVGAGFIGLEVAENLRQRGLDVTVVQRGEHVLPTMDAEMAQPLAAELRGMGIDIRFGRTVADFVESPDGVEAVLDDGERLAADLAIVSTGVRPRSELAKAAGLALGPRGHIVVDEHLRTSDPDIYAAGDVIEVVDPVFGGQTAIALAGPANKQGRIAADNICGGDSRYSGSQGSSVVKVFDLTAAATGVNETNAGKAGLSVDSVVLSPMSHAGYYPGGKVMTMKVVFEKETYRLLGAQIVGYEGVDKRIDVLATAIRAGLKATQLKELELAYAPPYSSAKDPVNMAGFMIENIANGVLKQWHLEDVDKLPRDGSVTLLDTRTVGEYAGGHIDGFTNIPVDQLRERLGDLDKSKPVYVICQSGLRSYIACRILSGYGFECYNFSGGFRFYDAVTHDRCLIEQATACGMDQ